MSEVDVVVAWAFGGGSMEAAVRSQQCEVTAITQRVAGSCKIVIPVRRQHPARKSENAV